MPKILSLGTWKIPKQKLEVTTTLLINFVIEYDIGNAWQDYLSDNRRQQSRG